MPVAKERGKLKSGRRRRHFVVQAVDSKKKKRARGRAVHNGEVGEYQDKMGAVWVHGGASWRRGI